MNAGDRLYETLLAQLQALPDEAFRTAEGRTAIVYSNRSTNPELPKTIPNWWGHQEINKLHALDLCSNDPSRYCIDTTEAGRWLDSERLFDRAEAGDLTKTQVTALWEQASLRFIDNARGNIETFAVAAPDDRVLRTTEIDAALRNDKITSLNNIDAEVLRAEPDDLKRFGMIVDAELARDFGGTPAMQATLERRGPQHAEFMAARFAERDKPAEQTVEALRTGEIEALRGAEADRVEERTERPAQRPEDHHPEAARESGPGEERADPEHETREQPDQRSITEIFNGRMDALRPDIEARAEAAEEQERLQRDLDDGRGR